MEGIPMENDFKNIVVKRTEDKVEVDNRTDYPMLGKGKQGAVFKISSKKCVKFYWNNRSVEKEAEVLSAGKGSPIMPKLYETGPNYLVMEFVEGQTFQEYIESINELPRSMVEKIVAVFSEMERLNFGRMDLATRHIIIPKNEKLKIIDHTNSFSKKQTFPKRFFNGLRRNGVLDSFLKQAKEIDKATYSNWEKAYLEPRISESE
jgi:predicted Ser/Thr protein kinase